MFGVRFEYNNISAYTEYLQQNCLHVYMHISITFKILPIWHI